MTLLLALVITLTTPSQADATHIAALACGEACGMGQEPLDLIIANLLYDAADHDVDWLPTRWYALLRPSAKVETLTWWVVERLRRGERWPRCRLIGSKRDAEFWLAGGYVEGEPDYRWSVKDMQVNAFGCAYPTVVFARVVCEGDLCPR